jgi:NDP-sugar pyrophosphorylase family protein
MPRIRDYVASCASSPLARWAQSEPPQLTAEAEAVVRGLLAGLSPIEYSIDDGVAVHRTAVIETGAILKPPLIVGANGLIAAGAYVRGGCWLGERCTLGPGVELKSSFVFAGTVLAHFNFVGDSVLGSDVNVEAGAVICNYRNERAVRDAVKFGALVGDGCRIGANAVLAPGTYLEPRSVVARLALIDQYPSAPSPDGRFGRRAANRT